MIRPYQKDANRETDINANGDIVGDYGAGHTQHGFLLHDGTFTVLDPPGSIFSVALGINAQGDIVGQYDDLQGKDRGFLLHNGTFVNIEVPGAMFTEAFGINARGDIVGWYFSAEVLHSFLLHEDAFTTIDPPRSISSGAFGINAQGDVVGFSVIVSGQAGSWFLLRQGTLTIIDPPSGLGIFGVNGINERGNIVGVYADAQNVPHAFVGQ